MTDDRTLQVVRLLPGDESEDLGNRWILVYVRSLGADVVSKVCTRDEVQELAARLAPELGAVIVTEALDLLEFDDAIDDDGAGEE